MTDAVQLHVCTTCQGGETLGPGELPMGRRLHSALAVILAAGDARSPAVELRETSCLANCERGCSAVLSKPGLWTYLLGRLSPEVADGLADYALTYAQSRNGTVMPSRRAASLRDVVMGRVPPTPGPAAQAAEGAVPGPQAAAPETRAA